MKVSRPSLGSSLVLVLVLVLGCGQGADELGPREPGAVDAPTDAVTPTDSVAVDDGPAAVPFAFDDPPYRPRTIEGQAHEDGVVQEQLDRLSAKLRVRDLSWLRGLLDDEFLGRGDFQGREASGGDVVGPDAFVEAWRHELLSWRRVRDVSLTLESARYDEEDGFVGVVAYTFGGMDRTGELVELLGEARVRAARTGKRSIAFDRWDCRGAERRVRSHGFVRHHHEAGLHPLDSHEERQGVDEAGHAALVVGDLDGDGAFDVFAPGLVSSALFLRRGTRFVDEAAERGLGAERGGTGGVCCDLDGDGADDLFVTKLGHVEVDGSSRGEPCRAYLRRGDGFVPGPAELELPTPSYVALPFDHDLDGDLDLFVGGYGVQRKGLGTRSGRGAADVLLVREERGYKDRARSLRVNSRGWARAAAAFDHDQDGDLDLVVVNENGTDRFFENRPEEERFVDLAVGETWALSRGESSALALEDVDGDGRVELVGEVCRGQAHVCSLGTLAPHRGFEATFLPVEEAQWSALGGDFDLDGRVDLLTLARARTDHKGEHS